MLLCPFILQHVFPINKDILLYSHSLVIKFRKYNINVNLICSSYTNFNCANSVLYNNFLSQAHIQSRIIYWFSLLSLFSLLICKHLSFSLFFMMLTLLQKHNLFYRISLTLGLSEIFLWLGSGYTFSGAILHEWCCALLRV